MGVTMRGMGRLEATVTCWHKNGPVYDGVHEGEDMRNRVQQGEPDWMSVVAISVAAWRQEGVDDLVAELVAMALGRIFG